MRKKRKRTTFKPRRRQRIQDDAAPTGLNTKPVQADARPPPRGFFYKQEVCRIVDRTWPQLWRWIRAGKFPKPRLHGGRPIWLQSDLDMYFAGLAECQYKPLESDAA
jgi:predicted DNA-binding transcriptional regulator AlpA